MMSSCVLRFSLALSLAALCAAQQNPYERMLESQRRMEAYLASEARRVTERAAAETASRETWEKVRGKRLREMREMLGLEPFPPKTALNVQITGVIDGPDYVIEKIAFESLPKVYATANFYIPKQRDGPLPTVIYVCGHAGSPYGAKTEYQRHGVTLALHGYAAFIIDPIQIAENFALHHGILDNEMYDWYARGYTPAGVEVWNVIRALDYLETRPEVDKDRFGITGRSGGAAMSWFAAAVDKRLKVVAPVMGISTYAANVAANTQRLHCDCMFVINSRLHDMIHQGALIAPRPLYMMHGRKDALFPVPGYEEFERVVGGLYRSYGAGEAFRNLVVDTAHKDSDLLRSEAVKWFDQWLKKVPEREIDLAYEELPHERLTVFGASPPKDARNYRVHEFFNPPPAERAYATLAAWELRRKELKALLGERVFAGFPAERPAPRLAEGTLPAPNRFKSFELETEAGMSVDVLFRRASEPGGTALLYIASDGEDLVSVRDTLRQIFNSDRTSLMILYPRGVGEVPWPKNIWKDNFRNAMQVGRTVDSMRLWDVLQAARALRERADGARVAVCGAGVAGALGLYAAILDEGIAQTILIDAPSTHRGGPIFLNVLRYTDLPEAAALVAPRNVTFYGRMPAAYRFTEGIYTLYGKPDNVWLTMSLRAAIEGRRGHGFSSGL